MSSALVGGKKQLVAPAAFCCYGLCYFDGGSITASMT